MPFLTVEIETWAIKIGLEREAHLPTSLFGGKWGLDIFIPIRTNLRMVELEREGFLAHNYPFSRVKKVFSACFDRQYISMKGSKGVALSPTRSPAILKLVRMGLDIFIPQNPR